MAAPGNWQQHVTDQLQSTAVILERLKGQLDSHDLRLRNLENQPATERASAQTQAMTWQAWMAAGAMVVALLSLLATHISVH